MWRQTSHATVKCSWPRPTRSYAVCQQLSAVQRTRRLAEVRWQVMAGALKRPGCIKRQCVVMRAPWVGQTGDAIYDVTIARHITFPHTMPSIWPAWCTSVNQSVSQAKQVFMAPYVASKSDASHCAQRPPTTNVLHATTACCQFDHRLLISYG